jgi:hypothetical protein
MKTLQQLESVLVNELARRGLRRAPGPLSFLHRGRVVRVTLKESLYRGLFVSVHDGLQRTQQFRAHDGAYDWDAIARSVTAVVARQLPTPAAKRAQVNNVDASLSIRPSVASPGRLRVALSEMDLDPVSAMQLYALIRDALPAPRSERALDAAML